MTIVTPFINEDILPGIERLCKKARLCYLYKPYTLEIKRGKKGSNPRKDSKPSVMWKVMLPDRL